MGVMTAAMGGSWRRRLRGGLGGALAATLALAGCASAPPIDAGKALQAAAPAAAPQAASTRFDESLRCMDSLFADYGVSGVTIAVTTVPDYTGRAFVSSDIWLQQAIARMSQRSKAFVITDFTANPLVNTGQRITLPAYYVRGAVSGMADSVASSSATGSIAGVAVDGGVGAAKGYSVISVNLHVDESQGLTLIGRTQSGNEVALESRSAGAQLGGRLSKFGANLEFTVSRNEGVPQAVRTLVELGAIETLGRLTGTPYWTCLGSAPDAPGVAETRRDVFENMTDPERLAFAARRLSRLGRYSGAPDGTMPPALASALGAYAAEKGLKSTTFDFALYERLTDWKADPVSSSASAIVRPPEPAPAPASTPPAATGQPAPPPPPGPPLSVMLSFASAGATAGAPVSLQLAATTTAFAQCYLEDAGGGVARVFPNQWQPDPVLKAGAPVMLPSPRAKFRLVLPPAGTRERVICFASPRDFTLGLADRFKTPDLDVAPGLTVQQLNDAFAAASGGSLVVSTQTLEVK